MLMVNHCFLSNQTMNQSSDCWNVSQDPTWNHFCLCVVESALFFPQKCVKVLLYKKWYEQYSWKSHANSFLFQSTITKNLFWQNLWKQIKTVLCSKALGGVTASTQLVKLTLLSIHLHTTYYNILFKTQCSAHAMQDCQLHMAVF